MLSDRSPGQMEQYHSLFENAVEGIYQATPDGQYIRVNPALARMFGYASAVELMEQVTDIQRQLYVDPGRRDEFVRLLEAHDSVSGFESQVYRKDGRVIWISVSARAVRDAEGRLLHYEGTVEDVTERVRAYQMLEQRVEERTREIERSRRELEALYRADEQLYRHLDVDNVLEALVDVVIDLLEADKSDVMVWDPDRGRLVVRASRGFSEPSLAMMSYLPGDGVAGRVFLSGEPLAVEDFDYDPSVAREIAAMEGIRSMLSVPIMIGGKVFGVFGMNYCYPRTFSADDRRLFLALAQRAALAIENAHLYEQVQQAAILEERRRLARELHDAVTQSLYSLTLFAEAGRRLARAGDLERVQGYLERLGETAQQALKEMRLLVYELRPLALEREGLVGALQQRLDAVEKRAGVQARLLVEDEVELPQSAEGELYRVAVEALNNALKHARATAVTVRIRPRATGVELVIADNGCGFDPEMAGDRSGVGLASMRERVARLGGALTLRSVPGEGTTIRVELETRQGVEQPGGK